LKDLNKYKFTNQKINVKELMIPLNASQAFVKDLSGVGKLELMQSKEKMQKC